jgi:hypothetical protein
MSGFMRSYIRVVDGFNRRLGRFTMYGIFVLVAILLWSSITKTFFTVPSRWTLEMAQFAMVAYYILGGPYSIQMGSNVRMDLFYGEWSAKRKAWFDALTVTDEGFSVVLNFGDSPEPLVIPFDALRTFVDPSVEFGLRFESAEAEDDDEDDDDPEGDDTPDPSPPRGEVVSLDKFRK